MILLKYLFHNNGVANWHKDCPTKSRKTEACLQRMCATRCRCPVLILKIFTSVFQSISKECCSVAWSHSVGHKTAATASDSRAPPPDPLSRAGNPFYCLHSNFQLSGFFKTIPHVETDGVCEQQPKTVLTRIHCGIVCWLKWSLASSN